MTKPVSCQPCNKRKVRCDRGEPCSNCKRRKQDQCTYVDIPQTERIKQLEALVSSLGGTIEHDPSPSYEQAKDELPSASPRDANSDVRLQGGTNPVIVNENGNSVYLESSSWHSWNGKQLYSDDDAHPRMPTLAITGPNALQSIFCQEPYIDVAIKHPTGQDSTTLWDIFIQRVHPLGKICFDREIAKFRAMSITRESLHKLTIQEHAFVFAVYLISVRSLSEDECMNLFQRSSTALFSDYQMLCEQALSRSGFFCATDITTIQASTLYITAGIERMETKSLWSMMSIVVRNAERSGLHRDGTLLGLSPYETERRRRVWWQLQHLDLALGVRSGSIPLNLSASWDARLPLNIEDEDIDQHMRETPKEREGLTSMTASLWTYWVLEEQRSFRHTDGNRLGFFWLADKTLTRIEKDGLIARLESGLNKRYLQFCDPIRPRDMLTQILARSFICGMRRVTLHPLTYNGRLSDFSETHRNELLDVCTQALEYDIAMQSNSSISQFKWRFEGHFQWSALVYVLIEAHRQCQKPRAEKIWALLSNLYAANQSLSNLSGDRRKSYVVELMTKAWRARENYLLERQQNPPYPPQKPTFLVNLENTVLQYPEAVEPEGASKRKLDQEEARGLPPVKKLVPAAGVRSRDIHVDDVAVGLLDLDPFAGFNFDAIDWSFWESVQ
ncbi:MAG: hypothetical protein Q9220_005177 [cf. Caloplaca sp. 1 TL-2023]